MDDDQSSSEATNGWKGPSSTKHIHETEHTFWNYQSVAQGPGRTTLNDSQIKSSDSLTRLLCDDRHELPDKFEWVMIEVNVDRSFAKLEKLISLHYWPDADRENIRIMNFYYDHDYLSWLLRAPNSIKSLLIAIRDRETKKLAGFIAGTPATIRIKTDIHQVVVANLLCIHKAHRFEGLTSVLITELARQAIVDDIWLGVNTTEDNVPTAFCSCKWLQLILNPKNLRQIGYYGKTSRKRQKNDDEMHNLPLEPKTIGFRRMKEQDVNAVTQLLKEYLATFVLAPVMNEHFVKHFLLPKQDLVESYVVEDPETLEITDFCSFVIQRKEVMEAGEWLVMKCAVLFYYAATKTSLVNLIGDLVGIACRDELDIFRAMGIMRNDLFLNELMFKPMHDKHALHYHLYNYGLMNVVTPKEIGFIVL